MMAAPWLQNLLQSPGFATAIGQFGSQMLAAPDFGQGLSALGQMPGHLSALKAEDELRQAEERRRKAEERLAALRISRGEAENRMLGLEEQALPGRIADEAKLRGMNVTGAERGLQRDQELYDAAAAMPTPPGVPEGLMPMLRASPGAGLNVATSRLPPTPEQQQRYNDEQALAKKEFDAQQAYRAEQLKRQKEEIERRTKEAQGRAAQELAALDIQILTMKAKGQEERKKQWLEAPGAGNNLMNRENWTDAQKDEWEALQGQDVQIMNELEAAQRRLRLSYGGENEPPSPGEVDPALVHAEITEKLFGGDAERARELMLEIKDAGLWPEVERLIREEGVPKDQAVQAVERQMRGRAAQPTPTGTQTGANMNRLSGRWGG